MMNLQSLISSQTFFHFAILFSVYFATWLYSLRGQFLIDDHDGVERFCDRYAITKDPLGNLVKEEKIDWYEENGKRYKNFHLNLSVGFYSGLLRYIRTNLGKRFVSIAKNSKGHDIYGYVQDPFKHHFLSVVLQFCNILLSYIFLKQVIGPDLAFKSVLLFSVHPIGCQAVAWISGFGYLVSLFFALITFNIAMSLNNDYGIIPILATNFLSVSALLSGIANPIILAFLNKWHAFSAAIFVSIFLLITWGKTIVTVRKKAFEEQNMQKSTKLNLRKPIVIIKTFYYYIRLILFPKSIGLFHVWGYHYEDTIERVDKEFWLGLLSIISFMVAYSIAPFPIKFGILWMFSYLILFSNIITAQQFVADRYAFISTLGYSIVVASILNQHTILYAFLLGLYMMRTLMHLPTFLDDKHLYESNIFNFPKSEVAYANLGVTLNQMMRPNGAIDMWQEAVKCDPFYDVPHYNLSAILKSSNQLEQARDELLKCLNSKTVHFRDIWIKELEQLNVMIERKREFDELNNKLNTAFNTGKFDEIPHIKESIDALQKRPLIIETNTANIPTKT